MEKTMILSGKSKMNNGVIRLSDDGYIKLNLNVDDSSYILVVKTDKIQAFNISKNDIFKYNGNLLGTITVLVCCNDEIVLFGCSNGDRIKAFSLYSEYKNLVKNNKIKAITPEKYVINKEEKPVSKAEEPIVEHVENTKKNEKNIKDNIIFDKNSVKNNVNNDVKTDKISEVKIEKQQIIYDDVEEDLVDNLQENSTSNIDVLAENEKPFNDSINYKGDNFYMAIHNQIDEIFVCYPEDKTLENLIENSKWARIDYDKNAYYLVGIIKENDEVKYVCYAIPASYSMPPKEINDVSNFIPIDKNNPNGNGYFVIYQDGKTGKTLSNN